jgi:hypothetical protein
VNTAPPPEKIHQDGSNTTAKDYTTTLKQAACIIKAMT